jgi:hypothetical protein
MAKRKARRQVPTDHITKSIRIVRGHGVLLDVDLAELYGVATKVLIQAVKRNLERFPADFMLQMTADEWESLRSQFVTSNVRHGGRRYAPFAFTEQGVAMLSSVLKSSRAIAVNIEIMRAFVRMRGGANASDNRTHQLRTERRVESHDTVITGIIKSIRELKNDRERRGGEPEPPEDEEE